MKHGTPVMPCFCKTVRRGMKAICGKKFTVSPDKTEACDSQR